MIVVVEGPSAAGKTTWAARHSGESVVSENAGFNPPEGSSPREVARFWSDANCRRWTAAVDMESAHGVAVCDTDPLKLHYDYCLALLGEVPWQRFDLGIDAATAAIGEHRVGIADVVLVSLPDQPTLERQYQADATRRRRNFELHRRLGGGLQNWYATLNALDPGRVIWEHPAMLPETRERSRYDVDLFGEWMSRLPRTL